MQLFKPYLIAIKCLINTCNRGLEANAIYLNGLLVKNLYKSDYLTKIISIYQMLSTSVSQQLELKIHSTAITNEA